jgi:hypothetical protein
MGGSRSSRLPPSVAQEPSEADLTDLLCQRYFEPERNWQLYELVVALRIARAFAERRVASASRDC